MRFAHAAVLSSFVVLSCSGLYAADALVADAVKERNTAAVAKLIRQGADVNVPQADGTTALHWAAHWNDLDMVERLLRAGAAANAVTRFGITPLSLAAENGNARIIEALLAKGVNPNAMPSGEPPIMTAARTGHADAVEALAAHGADVNAKEAWRGQTALMWAALENHTAAAQVLLAHGADADARSTGGLTALVFAARQGSLDAARVLLEAGARVNDGVRNGGPAALAVAISNLNYELAALLLEHRADPNATDRTGATPLHALMRARNPTASGVLRDGHGRVQSLSLLKVLLAAGANPNARTAQEPPRDSREQDILIDIGVNLGGATPFLLASKRADIEAMRVLMANGADPGVGTLERTTPLMVLSGVGYVEGADGGMRTEREVLDAARLVLDLGADVNAVSSHGQTALHGG